VTADVAYEIDPAASRSFVGEVPMEAEGAQVSLEFTAEERC